MSKIAHTSLIYFRLSENWIHTQVKHLNKFNSIVLTNRTENLNNVEWQPTIFSRSDKLPFFIRVADSLAMLAIGYYPSFYWKGKNEDIDLIHAHFGPMGYYSIGISDRLNIPLITNFYGYDASLLPKRKPKWKSKYQKLFKRGSLFLVEGPAMKEKLENLGCPSDKVKVHHLGVELDKYPVRKKFSNKKYLRLLMVGRFVEKKGFIYGLKAFQKFLEKGGKGSLTIIGDSEDNSDSRRIKSQMKEFVRKKGIQDFVKFTGMIPHEDLQSQYYQHDIFLAPSVEAKDGDSEGGAPVTVIEASASGMPVIGSRHCDIPEVVNDKMTGFLVKEKGADRMAEHLMDLFRKPKLRQDIGIAASKRIRVQFNAEKQGKKLGQIYEKCLGL